MVKERESVFLFVCFYDLVDAKREHRDNINDQEAPADGTVTLCNQAGKAEGGNRNAEECNTTH